MYASQLRNKTKKTTEPKGGVAISMEEKKGKFIHNDTFALVDIILPAEQIEHADSPHYGHVL